MSDATFEVPLDILDERPAFPVRLGESIRCGLDTRVDGAFERSGNLRGMPEVFRTAVSCGDLANADNLDQQSGALELIRDHLEHHTVNFAENPAGLY